MKLYKRITEALSLGYLFFRTTFQITRGYWQVMRLKQPCVSIFGGSRIKHDSSYAHDAYYIASELADAGISILTGGGPGIMEAAACGATRKHSDHSRAMGITTSYLIKTEPINSCVGEFSIIVNLYLARKWLLVYYSLGFVIFPGGVGTLDEFSTLFVLMDVKERIPGPVILFGREFWQPFIAWLDTSTQSGLIRQETRNLVTVTDDRDEAVKILRDHCEVCMVRGVVKQ